VVSPEDAGCPSRGCEALSAPPRNVVAAPALTSTTERARRHAFIRRGGTARSTRTTGPSRSSQIRSSGKRIVNVCTDRQPGMCSPPARQASPAARARACAPRASAPRRRAATPGPTRGAGEGVEPAGSDSGVSRCRTRRAAAAAGAAAPAAGCGSGARLDRTGVRRGGGALCLRAPRSLRRRFARRALRGVVDRALLAPAAVVRRSCSQACALGGWPSRRRMGRRRRRGGGSASPPVCPAVGRGRTA
jgi:hypothetical protein